SVDAVIHTLFRYSYRLVATTQYLFLNGRWVRPGPVRRPEEPVAQAPELRLRRINPVADNLDINGSILTGCSAKCSAANAALIFRDLDFNLTGADPPPLLRIVRDENGLSPQSRTSVRGVKEMHIQLTMFKKGLILVSVPLLTQLAFLGLFAEMQGSNAEVQGWFAHTKEVIAQTHALRGTLMEAETGARGLIGAGDPAAAQTFERARRRLPDELVSLKSLVGDNPEQEARAAALGE